MESRTEMLLAASAGVVGFAFFIVGGLLAGEFDAFGGTPSAIVDLYDGATFDPPFAAGVVLEALALLLLMAFVVKLAYLVQGSRDGAGWFGTVIVAPVSTRIRLLTGAQ